MNNLELKEARLSMGLSQDQIATKLNIHTVTYQRWESGRKAINPLLPLAIRALIYEHNSNADIA